MCLKLSQVRVLFPGTAERLSVLEAPVSTIEFTNMQPWLEVWGKNNVLAIRQYITYARRYK